MERDEEGPLPSSSSSLSSSSLTVDVDDDDQGSDEADDGSNGTEPLTPTMSLDPMKKFDDRKRLTSVARIGG